jgi:hypothetical protein
MSPSLNRALGDKDGGIAMEDGGIDMNDHYDGDLVDWAEAQSSLLRRCGFGELVNEAKIDWTNVAKQIDSVGRSERRSPSLRGELDDVVAAQTERARRIVAVVLTEYGQTPRKALNELTYSVDQVIGSSPRDPASS